MTISEWLQHASQSIARSDAELLMLHFIFPGADRSYLIAHDQDVFLPNPKLDIALAKRAEGCPLAYLVGSREFYGRDFIVEEGKTLIPRPETENIIEFCLDIADHEAKPLKIIDVGTGSGCVAITLALEIPNAEVTALDISTDALKIAQQNATKLGAKLNFQQSNLMQNYDGPAPDIIVANLPYVDKEWDWLDKNSLGYEPDLALYAENHGLELIYQLIEYFVASPEHGKYLILEADPSQHRAIITFAAVRKLELTRQRDFIIQFTRNA